MTGVNPDLTIQRATHLPTPSDADFEEWVAAALESAPVAHELVVRLVDEAESQALNDQYRGQDRPTNVLSFPTDLPPDIDLSLLGDIVICAPVVEREAIEQKKAPKAHWAHLTIHGVLHLLGYDHQDDQEAKRMETIECAILSSLGYANPYE
ncbi:rRNA maturation RNase YbeY [Spiribacter sp. C176]|uniref:Endoribonuclease YbeY n=1 Tax=Spiribacter salilacus TaxID=2664894 RepID=A0A6N7QRF6_9GAMM|nr:rRNA maturation RNase YbeY [Spiribacter salilacus]MRH78582.1 rRNA maturation RNase YbeY [Spiribacter salilacus]